MAQVLLLDAPGSHDSDSRAYIYQLGLEAPQVHSFSQLSRLIAFISVVGNSELDLVYPTVVILDDALDKPRSVGADLTELDVLDTTAVTGLLREHYKHLNVLVYKESELVMLEVREEVRAYHELLKNRIVRMKTWAGLNAATEEPKYLYTMNNALKSLLNTTHDHVTSLRDEVHIINRSVDFKKILKLRYPEDYYYHCIGNYSFVAHEFTCDESTLCAFLIFKLVFKLLPEGSPLTLDDNSLLSFLFALRDSYRGGNAFHNFRHAVDVLQATFYILVRTGSVPPFEGYTTSFSIHPKKAYEENTKVVENVPIAPLLSPEQSLSLLVASAGHDVGHPGLTNDFLAKFRAPVAQIYNGKSILENFHSAWFQRVLQLHWPVFSQDVWYGLQVQTILATDMGSHFEYISKIKDVGAKVAESRVNLKLDKDSVILLMSLIIKCADISNVTRPLNISAKWGTVLTREFSEIAQLSEHLTSGADIDSIVDPRLEPKFPETWEVALQEFNTLPKNQLFFISTFAQTMFHEVALVLPELRFMIDILNFNTNFWKGLNAQAEEPPKRS